MVKKKYKYQETLPLITLQPGHVKKHSRAFPTEVPVALTYNGISHVVMMATPCDLEKFATGFTLSEEIIKNVAEIKSLEVVHADNGIVIKISIPKKRAENLIKHNRNLVGQTGCGICGVAELDKAVRNYEKIQTKAKADKKAVFKALANLPDFQPINKTTGAVHAAAFCDWGGGIKAAFEDVGRHNAFDKLIGYMALSKMNFGEGFALLSSRGSFELVQKAISVKIPMLATISSATDLAVKLAKDHQLTLIALARNDSILILNDPDNLYA